jgi:peptidoglycan hydrolase CwlO-like protein
MICYFNNGLSRGTVANDCVAADGEVLFAHEATNAELESAFPGYSEAQKELKIGTLDAEYEPQFAELAQAYATALMAGDTTTAASVQEDYATLKNEYQAALEAINNG